MNELEQQDAPWEQSLREHYQSRYQQSHGPAPTTVNVWRQVLARVESEPEPMATDRARGRAPRRDSNVIGGNRSLSTPLRRSRRGLVVAASLVITLLVVSGAVYAARLAQVDTVLKSNPQTKGLPFSNVNVTKVVGDTTVHIEKAYADANNVFVAYSTDSKNATPVEMQPTLRTSDGVALTFRSGSVEFDRLTGKQAQGTASLHTLSVYKFDAVGIEGNPTSLNLTLTLAPQPLEPTAGNATPAPTPIPARPDATPSANSVDFKFSVPFHAAKVVAVNQTAMSSGHALTLDSVVIARSETLIYLHTDGVVYAGELQVKGQTYTSETGLKLLNGSRESGIIFDPLDNPTPSHVQPGAFWTLEGQTGTWTLHVTRLFSTSGQTITGDWTFTFTVA